MPVRDEVTRTRGLSPLECQAGVPDTVAVAVALPSQIRDAQRARRHPRPEGPAAARPARRPAPRDRDRATTRPPAQQHLPPAQGPADEGFVVHLPEQRRYGLGVAAFELGSAYSRQESLRWIAQTVLTRLVSATTHNAHLAVLHGRDVLYVIEERAPHRPAARDRRRRPAPRAPHRERARDARALPPQQLNALFPSRRELTQPPRRRADLAHAARERCSSEANERGYAEEDGFVTPGLASVATAVLDHCEHPVAAVALTFPADDARPGRARRPRSAGGEAGVRAHSRGQSP